jgi:hypothetical protein
LNDAQHTFDVGKDVIVPESQYPIAARIEKIRSLGVCDHLIGASVLPAV